MPQVTVSLALRQLGSINESGMTFAAKLELGLTWFDGRWGRLGCGVLEYQIVHIHVVSYGRE